MKAKILKMSGAGAKSTPDVPALLEAIRQRIFGARRALPRGIPAIGVIGPAVPDKSA